MDQIELVITSATAVVVAIVGVWQARAGRSLKEVRNQVANNHGAASLREDLDAVKVAVTRLDATIAGLHELVRSQGHQIGEIRADLREDRKH